jgi:hypothetical protein
MELMLAKIDFFQAKIESEIRADQEKWELDKIRWRTAKKPKRIPVYKRWKPGQRQARHQEG